MLVPRKAVVQFSISEVENVPHFGIRPGHIILVGMSFSFILVSQCL